MRSMIMAGIEDREKSSQLGKAERTGIFAFTGRIFLLAFLLFLSGCGGGGGSVEGTSSLDNSNSLSGGRASLQWEAPGESNDGSTTAAVGYKVYVGTNSPVNKQNSLAIDVGNVTTYSVEELGVGTYYFAVTAYDSAGAESTFSNEVRKEITGT